MQYFHDFDTLQLENTVVACGKFDGIHAGHRKLLEQLFFYQEKGFKSTIFTFDASISKVMQGTKGFIYTSEERCFCLEQLGIDYLVEYRFEEPLSRLTPEQFVEQILIRQLGAKVVVVGEDFRFGYQRQGDVELLGRLEKTYGYELVVVSKCMDGSGKVSSSEIRNMLIDGEMEQTARLLGRPYFIRGEVIHGRQLGRSIGMPTANVAVPEGKLIPPNGVYVSRCFLGDRCFYGITNIGTKPTVQGEEVGVETFLFDFDEDIYGEILTVEFLTHVRREQRFHSVEELSAQMHRDALYGQEYIREKRYNE